MAVERRRKPWVSTVTSDAIRHFAWGVGDNNPLWLDRDHARSSIWGDMIAPPCLAYAVDETTVAPGRNGDRRVYQAVEWVWLDVMRMGERLEASAELAGESEHDDGVEQAGRVEVRRADGSLVAVAKTRCLRTTTPAPSIESRPELRYTPTKLAEIESVILAEQRRGANPRHWEDVAIGEELGPLLKGPLSIMDVVAWSAATTGVTGPEDEHSEGGLHTETATGPEQVAWLAQLLTDWMGDDGFLHRLDVRVASNPPLGSTTALSGLVTGKEVVAGSHVVALDVVATDQDGRASASGKALLILPSAKEGPVSLPLDEPIPKLSS